MVKDIQTTLRYWFMVAGLAMRSVARSRLVRGYLIGACLALISFFFIPFLVTNRVVPSEFVEYLNGIYRNGFWNNAGLLIAIGMLIFFGSLFYQPAKLHEEQSKEIKRITDAYEALNLPCPLIITPYQGWEPNKILPREIKIRIKNPLTTQSVGRLRVTLDELWQIHPSPTDGKTKIVIDDAAVSRGFPHVMNFEPDGSITPNQDAIVSVAKVESGIITFDLAKPLRLECDDIRRDKLGSPKRFADFELIISVNGFIEHQHFMKTRYSIHAHFEDAFAGDDLVFSSATIMALEKLSNDQQETDLKVNSAPKK